MDSSTYLYAGAVVGNLAHMVKKGMQGKESFFYLIKKWAFGRPLHSLVAIAAGAGAAHGVHIETPDPIAAFLQGVFVGYTSDSIINRPGE